MFYQVILSFSILMLIFLFLLILCSKFKYMCNNLKIRVNPKLNDDAINCTMQIPSTYVKFVFMQFNKERYKIIILPTNY